MVDPYDEAAAAPGKHCFARQTQEGLIVHDWPQEAGAREEVEKEKDPEAKEASRGSHRRKARRGPCVP